MTYLIILIEQYKKELAERVAKYGITSDEAVECSQKLDEYLNLLAHVAEKKE
ncbi:aspartyl-phosphate phosphatase Spo0E family protein [Neobacillus rhizosphaerae]|uniref:Spo0E family sporulation regulatory protein-aspartic acid phosphatase n=1 Tax=Neobacillus rhizosphaerae TaxID=2880965 RepID=UPI003D2D81B5